MKILSVQGSFTLVPDAKPLTSTYLSLVNGLNTYPGFPGTGFPVGNEGVGAEARDDEIPVDGCAVSVCVVRWSAPDDDRRWPRSFRRHRATALATQKPFRAAELFGRDW